MPDVADELRAEARAALAENNGVLTTAAIQGMKKLDSFLKEDLRCHGLSACKSVLGSVVPSPPTPR